MSDVQPAPEWPPHFPRACPPTDADPASGWVFRLVERDPPTAEDFKSYLERGLAPSADDCQRAGLSTYREKEHAEATRKRIPKLSEHLVALADLDPEHGRIRATGGRGHYTLWMRRQALELAPTLFAVPNEEMLATS